MGVCRVSSLSCSAVLLATEGIAERQKRVCSLLCSVVWPQPGRTPRGTAEFVRAMMIEAMQPVWQQLMQEYQDSGACIGPLADCYVTVMWSLVML